MFATASQNMQYCIKQKLYTVYSPIYLEVINESYQHNVAPHSESHFKVIVISEKFEKKSMINRHREIYTILANELTKGAIYALALHTYTLLEWEKVINKTLHSPECCSNKAYVAD
ncbi:DNA-binding transcriptional regulator BolA [Candidatus Hartigia pinicola]|nr:DNA-binding transcriptional regulator BolA [Candidatus Hartigia pinicola]